MSSPAAEPHAARTRTASLTSPASTSTDRKPTQGELARERDLLGGNWAIQSIVDDGESLASNLILRQDGRGRKGPDRRARHVGRQPP